MLNTSLGILDLNVDGHGPSAAPVAKSSNYEDSAGNSLHSLSLTASN